MFDTFVVLPQATGDGSTLFGKNSDWEAYERFVMLGAIALGLLQFISLKDSDYIWNHFDALIRTRSRQFPSERTVR